MNTRHDIFISHASEDKQGLVFALASILADLGVNVWYDEFELRVGDSLSRSIDKGLASSSFGAVVISQAFLTKKWPEYELRGLITKEIEGEKVILPIWYGVNKTVIAQYSPTLADKVALNADQMSVEDLAVRLIEVCRPDLYQMINRLRVKRRLENNMPKGYIDASKLKPGPYRRNELPESLVVRTHLFHALVREVIPLSLADTIDNFLRDSEVVREVEIFERISACYNLATKGKGYRLEKKKEIYSAILRISMGPLRSQDTQRFKHLSANEVSNLEIDYLQQLPIS